MAKEMKVIELKAAATGRVSGSGPWLTWWQQHYHLIRSSTPPPPPTIANWPVKGGRGWEAWESGKVWRLTTEDSDKLAWRVVGVQFA